MTSLHFGHIKQSTSQVYKKSLANASSKGEEYSIKHQTESLFITARKQKRWLSVCLYKNFL